MKQGSVIFDAFPGKAFAKNRFHTHFMRKSRHCLTHTDKKGELSGSLHSCIQSCFEWFDPHFFGAN